MLAKFLPQGQIARRDDGCDLVRKISTNPRELCELLGMFSNDSGDGFGQIPHRHRRPAVGPNPERILTLQFQKVCDLVKDLGDFRVFHDARLRVEPDIDVPV